MWQRLRSLLRIKAIPDSTEELEHEIQELLEEGEEQGLISSHEEQLINSIFDFRDTVAAEIMTPSAEMSCADQSSSINELIDLVTREGHTRIPIYRETPDQIIGILHAKDLLRFCNQPEAGPATLAPYLNPPLFIRESMPITDLLRDFQSRKKHLALVTDEFGSIRGLVTLEDVIEEIVGEIDDEHDQEDKELQVIDPRTVVVDAKIPLEAVEEHFHQALPHGPYASIGGLLMHRLGRIPQRGDTLTLPPLTLQVLTADQRRVKTVRIRKDA